jgi:hypothetical protein
MSKRSVIVLISHRHELLYLKTLLFLCFLNHHPCQHKGSWDWLLMSHRFWGLPRLVSPSVDILWSIFGVLSTCSFRFLLYSLNSVICRICNSLMITSFSVCRPKSCIPQLSSWDMCLLILVVIYSFIFIVSVARNDNYKLCIGKGVEWSSSDLFLVIIPACTLKGYSKACLN